MHKGKQEQAMCCKLNMQPILWVAPSSVCGGHHEYRRGENCVAAPSINDGWNPDPLPECFPAVVLASYQHCTGMIDDIPESREVKVVQRWVPDCAVLPVNQPGTHTAIALCLHGTHSAASTWLGAAVSIHFVACFFLVFTPCKIWK